ncbi:MAG: S1 RNA-binding domain-containing protein, partial [Nitrospinae bacterium]|nr:S1 RNA-binding domain-containing protein [Nitrospinota bacterium]
MQKLEDDFDDLDEKEELSPEDQAAYREMEEYYEHSLKKFREGEIIQGRVIHLSKDTVTVDVGFKSEGIINLKEFSESEKDLQVGDEIEVYLERAEDNEGIVVLSKEKANKIKIWEKLVKAFEAEEIIEGTVIAKAKGGLTVDIGLKSFLPGSQIDLRPVRNLEKLIGEK